MLEPEVASRQGADNKSKLFGLLGIDSATSGDMNKIEEIVMSYEGMSLMKHESRQISDGLVRGE